MIIGIDASRANKKNKTGVEWYSFHLIEQMKKIDSENQYFLYTNNPLEQALKQGPSNFQEVRLKWLPKYLWTLARLSYEMKFGKHKCNLLFVPAHTIPLLNPKKVVVTVHDIGFERYPHLYKWIQRAYHKFTIRFIKKFATKIITVSKFSKQELIEVYKIPAEKIKVVYNGYDSNVYKRLDKQGNEQDQLKEKYQISAPYFMFTGRLEAKKNIASLVEAFGLFKQQNLQDKHQLVLVGAKGYGFDQVEENIKKYQLHNEVVHIDWLSAVENAWLLNNADLFVFPSNYEGFGIPVLEAMACGCPVICSNTTSLPEVAGQAAIMFNPKKPMAIVKAMQTVIDNPDVCSALVQKGFEQVQKFSWQKCAHETLQVFETLSEK